MALGHQNVSPSPALGVANLSFAYGPRRVLTNVSFEVERGAALCVVGPSGCGKTTLLRLIAGLLNPQSGRIFVEGVDVTRQPTHKKDIGFIFQGDDALFPHLTVKQNVEFAFRHNKKRRQSQGEWNEVVNRIINEVGLSGYPASHIHELSGGLKQRVAIARALVYKPSIILLDEPLSSLDNSLKEELLDLLRVLKRTSHSVFVYVTHDDREVSSFADFVVVLVDGQVLQQGTLKAVQNAPANETVRKLLHV